MCANNLTTTPAVSTHSGGLGSSIPTLWNFRSLSSLTRRKEVYYPIEQKIIIRLVNSFLFPKRATSTLFWWASLSAHFLSLHKCTVDQGMISRVATLPEISS